MVWEGGLPGCPGGREMVDVGVRGNWRKFWTTEGFPGSSKGKDSACNAGDLGLIPGLARSSRKGNGNPLQYSCLENTMDRGTWWPTGHEVTKSQTWLSNSHTHTHTHWMTMEVREYQSYHDYYYIFGIGDLKIMYYLEPKYISRAFSLKHGFWNKAKLDLYRASATQHPTQA